MFKDNLPLVLLSWMVVIAFMAVARQRRHTAGVGLVLAYVLSMWLIHWPASLLYVLPWYNGYYARETIAGTEQSLYAVAAFAFGSVFITPFLLQSGILPRSTGKYEFDPRLPKTYMGVGAFFFVLASSPIGHLPSVSAVVSSGEMMIVVGLGLTWWQGWREGNRSQMTACLVLALSLPLITVVTRGFIFIGAMAALSFLIFIWNFASNGLNKVRAVAFGLILAFGGLSLYVNYMRDRREIRNSVWGGESYSDRFSLLEESASKFELFDPRNPDHLARIDDRLNQSWLVGSAVFHLEETGNFARGETLVDALLALVPRAFWPDKPITAGSGNLVERYTGIHFNNVNGGTSIGIGSVMEFYINFGTTGIIVGFLFLGVLITTLDILATERLANQDLSGFILFYLPGLACLQVGGQLVETTASAAGAVIVALLVSRYLHRYQRAAQQPPLIHAMVPVASPGMPGPMPTALHRTS